MNTQSKQEDTLLTDKVQVEGIKTFESLNARIEFYLNHARSLELRLKEAEMKQCNHFPINSLSPQSQYEYDLLEKQLKFALADNCKMKEALKVYARRQPDSKFPDEKFGWNWIDTTNGYGQCWEFDYRGEEQDAPYEIAEKALSPREYKATNDEIRAALREAKK